MPTRLIREGILDSRGVNSLSEPAEIFYRRLMSVVDDFGRFEADAELLRARCFPRQLDRWSLSRVSDALNEAATSGDARLSDGSPLISVYQIPGSDKKYLQINNFGQRIRKGRDGEITESRYPAPSVAVNVPRVAATSGDKPPYAKAYAESKTETETGAAVERMCTLHPKTKDSVLVPEALENACKIKPLAEIETSHAEWCKSEAWTEKGGRFAPTLAAWLVDRGYTKRPAAPESNGTVYVKVP